MLDDRWVGPPSPPPRLNEGARCDEEGSRHEGAERSAGAELVRGALNPTRAPARSNCLPFLCSSISVQYKAYVRVSNGNMRSGHSRLQRSLGNKYRTTVPPRPSLSRKAKGGAPPAAAVGLESQAPSLTVTRAHKPWTAALFEQHACKRCDAVMRRRLLVCSSQQRIENAAFGLPRFTGSFGQPSAIQRGGPSTASSHTSLARYRTETEEATSGIEQLL